MFSVTAWLGAMQTGGAARRAVPGFAVATSKSPENRCVLSRVREENKEGMT